MSSHIFFLNTQPLGLCVRAAIRVIELQEIELPYSTFIFSKGKSNQFCLSLASHIETQESPTPAPQGVLTEFPR